MADEPFWRDYEDGNRAFQEGQVADADDATLLRYLSGFANYPVPNPYIHHLLIIRGLTINHILLQRHIAKMEKQAGVLQWIVITLTFLAVVVGGVQIWVAFNPPGAKAKTAVGVTSRHLPPWLSDDAAPLIATAHLSPRPHGLIVGDVEGGAPGAQKRWHNSPPFLNHVNPRASSLKGLLALLGDTFI